jgi:hypothetical protein
MAEDRTPVQCSIAVDLPGASGAGGAGDVGGTSGGSASEADSFGPIARMMMSVAAHAITSHVQFRTLAELLIERGILTREELEARFEATREKLIPATIEEWFEPDIAYHLKMAVQASQADPGGASGGPGSPDAATESSAGSSGGIVAPAESDELARARAMQSGTAQPE